MKQVIKCIITEFIVQCMTSHYQSFSVFEVPNLENIDIGMFLFGDDQSYRCIRQCIRLGITIFVVLLEALLFISF